MEMLFTTKGLRLDNKNIKFFSSDMFMECKNKEGDKFIAEDTETLTAFLCASLDSMCEDSGLGVAFMNDNTCYIAIQPIGKIGTMNSVEFVKSLDDFIDKFDIKHMTILQQSKYDNEKFHFISNDLAFN